MNWMGRHVLGLLLAFSVTAAAEAGPQGVVRVDGHVLTDTDGPFLGLGATYMQALRHCKFDRERLHRELGFLSSCGFNYVRVLSMVDWPGQEIAPVPHQNREGKPVAAWPDYDAQLTELVDMVHSHGLRAQVTIFADAQWIMPDARTRREHLERVMRVLAGREEKIILYEIANEAWQNGFPGETGVGELHELGREAARRSPALLALSSPFDMENRAEGLVRLYAGSSATIATMHFSRDTRGEMGAWLPVIDCRAFSRLEGLPPISSNEPIGPGSSVASEADPVMILSAAAFAFLSGLPMYVFHSAAGVKAEESFEDMPWLRQFGALTRLLPRDLPNWQPFDSGSDGNPLTATAPDVPPLYQCGARKGRDFVCLLLALPDAGREFKTDKALSFSTHTLPSGERIGRTSVKKGEVFTITAPSTACILKGVLKS